MEEGRYIAEHIPGARFVELPGADHLPWIGDQDAVRQVGIEVRAGLHSGECEVLGEKLAGVAVHPGAGGGLSGRAGRGARLQHGAPAR
ncbi:MAG TPA: hypothetical protein VEQ37_03965 [Actinomycetota bacterium]|nr:hypothetical protein [Actinomycetota bacterium]